MKQDVLFLIFTVPSFQLILLTRYIYYSFSEEMMVLSLHLLIILLSHHNSFKEFPKESNYHTD